MSVAFFGYKTLHNSYFSSMHQCCYLIIKRNVIICDDFYLTNPCLLFTHFLGFFQALVYIYSIICHSIYFWAWNLILWTLHLSKFSFTPSWLLWDEICMFCFQSFCSCFDGKKKKKEEMRHWMLLHWKAEWRKHLKNIKFKGLRWLQPKTEQHQGLFPGSGRMLSV